MLYAAILQPNLQRQQESEEELVVLIESSTGVLEHFICEVVNDALDTLAGNR